MKPVTQSRTGANGTCFRACLASILELPENRVTDFTGDGEEFFAQVDEFLAPYGLRYRRVPLSAKPAGYSTIEGMSPREGLHACVAYNGLLVHDPHPLDGTGRGLLEPYYYGRLEQTERAKATDAGRFTVASANAALRAAGYKEKLAKGGGYYYFYDGDAERWYDRSIPTYSISNYTAADIIRARNHLANDWRNN